MHPAVAQHLRAIGLFRGVLTQVGAVDLDRPTPCQGWTVRDLLAHQLGQDLAFTAALGGGSREVARWAPVPVGDDIAAPMIVALAEQERALRSFGEPDDARIWMPEILPAAPLPAGRALTAHLIDLVVHSWDLAVSIGAALDVPDELVATCLPVARSIPDTPEARGAGHAFAGALAVASAAGPLDEILLRLGRDPAWSPASAGS